jgi:hypothetical protein
MPSVNGRLGVLVDGHRDDPEAVAGQLVVQRLPARQLVGAAAPRGEGDDEGLAAPHPVEGEGQTVEVGQRERRGLAGRELGGPGGGRRAEHGDALVGVDHQEAAGGGGQAGEVDPAVLADQAGVEVDRDAPLAAAQAGRLRLPAGGGGQVAGGEPQRA